MNTPSGPAAGQSPSSLAAKIGLGCNPRAAAPVAPTRGIGSTIEQQDGRATSRPSCRSRAKSRAQTSDPGKPRSPCDHRRSQACEKSGPLKSRPEAPPGVARHCAAEPGGSPADTAWLRGSGMTHQPSRHQALSLRKMGLFACLQGGKGWTVSGSHSSNTLKAFPAVLCANRSLQPARPRSFPATGAWSLIAPPHPQKASPTRTPSANPHPPDIRPELRVIVLTHDFAAASFHPGGDHPQVAKVTVTYCEIGVFRFRLGSRLKFTG